MIILIVLGSILLFASVWCALVASGRANDKEEREILPFNTHGDDDE